MRICKTVLAFCAAVILSVNVASAHAIDYIASNISPAANFNGKSGNFTLSAPVQGGSTITFTLAYSLVEEGKTATLPRNVAFGVTDITKPANAPNPTVSLNPASVTFTSFTGTGSNFTSNVQIIAPAIPGAYSVKIAALSGTGGNVGLNGSTGVVVTFTVASVAGPGITQVPTSLSVALSDGCIELHQPSVTLSAKLTYGNAIPLPAMTVTFYVDGQSAGSATTDGTGSASLIYNTALLPVGDHSVVASFQGALLGSTEYLASSASDTLGVQYLFIGYQQPVNADGTSVFSGRVVPVKIRIADFFGNPVTNAAPYLYYAIVTATVIGTDAEPVANSNGDTGNLLRYDPSADQYILNWDVNNIPNGTYNIRVDLGEGSCANAHIVTLSLKRKK